MTKLLLRLFLKGRDPASPDARGAVGALAGGVGIVGNVLLFLLKLAAGLLSGSVAMIADGWNNLSDAASSVVTLLGFRLAQRPADQDHPYGHARYEYLSALAVAVMILVIGVELAKSSFEKILEPQTVVLSGLSVGILLAAMAAKLWMMQWFRTTGRLTGSEVLKATAADCRNDVLATGGVLAGSLAGWLFDIRVDGWIGLAVAVFILYSGVTMARQTVSPLLGQQADRELVEKIRAVILSHDKVLGIHDLLVHDYGPGRCFASVHAEVSAHEDPMVSHAIIDDIERDVLREVNVHLVIHYDPVDVEDRQWQQLRACVEETAFRLDPRLSVHDLRLDREGEQIRLVFDLEVPYAMKKTHRELKNAMDEALRAQGIDYETVIHFDGKA